MEKILVIDDEKPFRLVVMAALQRQGYEVMGAGDGTEGLAQTFAAAPSLVLTDVNMAGQSGFDFLRQLRAHPQTAAIPVIIMTGETHKADARFSMHQGADDYLQKPFAMEEMLATVAARLQRRAGINEAVEAQHAAEMMSAAENLRLQTSALDAAANGIAITHRTGKILWVNPAFTKLTGYAAEEAIGRNPRFLNSGRHAPEFFADLWATINAGKVWHGELINRRKNGTTYFEEMTITPVRDAGGQIQNFIAIKQDVSGRKQIEKELAQERDLLQALMDHQPDHIYFKDLNSRFTRINRANAALAIERVAAKATAEQYRLFSSYQEARHAGGDMALMGFYDYRSMVEDSPINTFLAEFRRPDGVLEAACLTDLMNDGLSAVYSFFRASPGNSLGTYMILWLVQEAKRVGLPYVYLGYWIGESEKMAYKSRFSPLEAFGPGGWRRMVL